MSVQNKLRIGAGYLLHALVGGLMIFAGLGKVFGFAPPEVVNNMERFGLTENLQLIGWGELITAILLLVPRTSSLGILLTSSFWGGAICIHMAYHESYVFQSVFLLLSWAGAALRSPATFASFCQGCGRKPAVYRSSELSHA